MGKQVKSDVEQPAIQTERCGWSVAQTPLNLQPQLPSRFSLSCLVPLPAILTPPPSLELVLRILCNSLLLIPFLVSSFPLRPLYERKLSVPFSRDRPSSPQLAPPLCERQLCPPWITTWRLIPRGRPSHTTFHLQAIPGPYRHWMGGSRV